MPYGIFIATSRTVPPAEIPLDELALWSDALAVARLPEPLRGQRASLLVPFGFDRYESEMHNRRATLLWWYFNGRGLVIHGDVVVVGDADESKYVPEPLRRNLLEQRSYGIRVRLPDSDWLEQDRLFGDYFSALYEALVLQRDWQDLLVDLEVFVSE